MEASPLVDPPENKPDILPTRSIPSAPLDQNTRPNFVPAWRRPTLADTAPNQGTRRPSVQFVPQVKIDTATSTQASRASSAQPYGRKTDAPQGRRFSSPPPPAQFRASVGFDTFTNKEAADFSLTLNRKHRNYEYTKRSRNFLCGTDTNDYSDTALEWLIDELVDDGDEIVCLRVVEKDSKEAVRWSGGMGTNGYRREAERFLDAIEKKNTEDRAISLVLEFSIGKVEDMIQQMIRIYEPAMLVVGTKGKSLTGYQSLLSSGSVSKYCLQNSPVPVVVVRPSSKREAKKRKRLQDPSRTGYRDILDKSEEAPRGRGGHLLDAQNRFSVASADLGALGELGNANDPDQEARMVAEAIGYRGDPTGGTVESANHLRQGTPANSAPTSPNATSLKPSDLDRDPSPPSSPSSSDDSSEDTPEGYVRPEDEAALLAYERAQKIMEEEREEAELRAEQQRERSKSRGKPSRSQSQPRRKDEQQASGAAVLGVLAQLDRGLR